MADIGTKFGLGSSGSGNFTDPIEFSRSVVTAANFYYVTSAASGVASNVSGFFTAADIVGIADDTNWTADTYKTIVSVTGSGDVAALVGPTGLTGTPTTTFEITRDGVLTEVAVVQTTTGQRSVLGPSSPYAGFTTAGDWQRIGSAVDAGKTTTVLPAYALGAVLPSWQSIAFFGTPCLSFKTSLLVRMKTSETNSTTTNQERQCSVQYRVTG